MTLASDAMKGLTDAEGKINSEPKQPKPTTQKTVKQPKEELSEAVQELMNIKNFIEKNKLGIKDGARNYVKLEVWQYIAQIKGLIPTFDVEDGYDDKGVYWCKSTCTLRTVDGREITRSTMLARMDEDFTKDKDVFATMGLAETRSLSRAVKNVYGYLLVAIGYQATPIEEINDKKGK